VRHGAGIVSIARVLAAPRSSGKPLTGRLAAVWLRRSVPSRLPQ
jgi:hypothetical protein